MLGLCNTPTADLDMSPAELALQHPPLLPSKLICCGALTAPVPTLAACHHCVSPHLSGLALDTAEHDFASMDLLRTKDLSNLLILAYSRSMATQNTHWIYLSMADR